MDTVMTHELRLNGAHLMKGDANSIAIVFNNLNGRNFAPPRPIWSTQNYPEYLAYMERVHGVTFAGGLLELAEIGQPATERHQFD